MRLKYLSSFPHPNIIFAFCFVLLLIGQPLLLVTQLAKPSKKELRTARIDSIFSAAEQNDLYTRGILHYEFYFHDPVKKRLQDFAFRMTKDSFETLRLYEKDKTWYLALYKNTRYTRDQMYEQEQRMRGMKYSYYIDDYTGFSIYTADPDPVSIADKDFPEYIRSLSDEDLFWVGKRLLDVKSYKRARTATEFGVHRQYKPDTAAYHYGLALVSTGDPDDGIVQWKKSIKLNPNYLAVFMALGKIHYENGYFDKALEYFKRADSLSPNQSDILLKISETLYTLKLYNQSYDYAVQAHQLNKKNVYAKSLLRLLKKPSIKYARKKYPEK